MKEKFSAFYDKHYQRLINYSFKLLKQKNIGEDLVQETYINLFENIEKINGNERSIESFLIVTLKRKIIDYYRKKNRENHTNNLYFINKILEEEIDNEWELCQEVDSIYSSLSEKTRIIFQLSRNKGLTYKEIAKVKNISVKTVELHISKALTAFRNGLKDYL